MSDATQGPPGDDNAGLRDKVETTLRDVLRRTVSGSQGAKQMTEEAIRGAISDFRLPKELAGHVIQQVDTVKTEIVRVTANEVRSFLNEANIGEELAKILTTLSFEIRTEVRFIPNDKKLQPDVNSQIRLKSDGDRKATADVTSDELDSVIRASVSNLADRFLARRRGRKDAEGEPLETPEVPARPARRKLDPEAE